MTTDPALRALCPVCGTPGRIVSSDEGTSHFAAEAAPLDETKRRLAQAKAEADIDRQRFAAAEAAPLDVKRLERAWVDVEMEDERLGVIGRGRFIDRITAKYAALAAASREGSDD